MVLCQSDDGKKGQCVIVIDKCITYGRAKAHFIVTYYHKKYPNEKIIRKMCRNCSTKHIMVDPDGNYWTRNVNPIEI